MEFERAGKEWLTEQEKEDWEKLAKYRTEVLKLLEEARQRKEIGSSLEAAVLFQYAEEDEPTVNRFREFLPELFIVSQVQLQRGPQTRFEVQKASGTKCMRCWQFKEDVGKHASYPNVCIRCAKVLDQFMVGKT